MDFFLITFSYLIDKNFKHNLTLYNYNVVKLEFFFGNMTNICTYYVYNFLFVTLFSNTYMDQE